MQCKAFKSNKMSYSEFKVALGHIAELLGVDVEEVVTAIIASQGPLANNITLPKYIKAHDDKGAWTGAGLHLCAVTVHQQLKLALLSATLEAGPCQPRQTPWPACNRLNIGWC
jgi:hypothetical protein